MLVKELLHLKTDMSFETLPPTATVLELAYTLRREKISSAIVMDEMDKMIGIVTETDVVKAVVEDPLSISKKTIGQVMSKNIITASPDDKLSDVFEQMTKHGIRRMPIVQDGIPITIIGIHDVRKICDHLSKLANTDALTGLPNRREFEAGATRELNKYKRFGSVFSIAIFDIDFFKAVNDTHGHASGDMALKKFAEVLSVNLRNYDLVARIGGEEFALILPNTDYENAIRVTNKLLGHVREIVLWADTGTIKLTASAGLTTANLEISDVDSMIDYADRLLYKAKANGRDQVIARPYETAAGKEAFDECLQQDEIFFG